jgi:hypothetical protein
MAKRHEVFPSPFLSAADLNGKPVTLTIESAPLEKLKGTGGSEETKTVLYFKGTKKSLPLNRTNWDKVADITGEDDSNDWPGRQIQLYPTTTPFRTDVVDCIRIREPEQGELKPAKAKPAKAKPSLAEEMDDEIPDFGKRE